MRPELARAHLLYGEWLRRQRRRPDAGEHRHGSVRRPGPLRAAGGTARQAAITAAVQLTAQEAQIARLAAGGLSNPEIAPRLCLSPRTVQYHFGKVFTKLGITSRGQLSRALAGA
jgi:DNA-binding CsgD family transcriptional regulator